MEGGIKVSANWITYNELAWTEDFLADPADYEKETAEYIRLMNKTALEPVLTVLHLGCGAGGHDRIFKRHFQMTGVDISLGMLNKAREANPEIEYHEGDMRSFRLNRQFDCVAIPDSIDYMASLEDLKKALFTAAIHLKPGGVLLIVGKTKETFQNNNFVYSGEKGDTQITLFENNYINPYVPNTYDITMVYLIRQKGRLTTHVEKSVGGLFSLDTWIKAIKECGFSMETQVLDGIYDEYLLEGGAYPLTIFIGRKE
ncbi:MAG TPA: class I SAM-dependent methyltransferase [Bacteroidales bacterium]|nr:class I SAM-dependent methyltransferase [Bacteroidales bacterium]